MNKPKNRFEKMDEKRMLSLEEAALYTGLGLSTCKVWLREIGAVKKIGRRVLCDRLVIDRALDTMTA